MILGIGIDLAEISRISRACEKENFRRRIFTESENARIDERGMQTAAGIFAAKEAVAKALGTGFRAFGPDSVEILVNELGRPECHLYKGALEQMQKMGAARMLVSITHTGDMAAAVAILEADA